MATRSRSELMDCYAEGSSTKGTFTTSTASRRLQVEPPRDPAGRPVGRHQLKDLVQGHGSLRSRHPTICGPPSARGQLGCPPPSAPGAQPRYLSTAEPRNGIARNNTFITALTMYRSMDWTQ